MDDLPPQMQTGWDEFEIEIGPTLTQEMGIQSPVATGQLADSQSWRDNAGVLEILSTDNRGPVARWVIYGTRPHPIDPVNGQFLHWIGQDGRDVFARHVDHPGTAANPYNLRAWETQRGAVLSAFGRLVGLPYALAYLNPWLRDKSY